MLAEYLLRERGFDVDAQEGDEEARGPIPSAADRADASPAPAKSATRSREQVLAAGDFASSAPSATSPGRIDNQLRGRSAVRATRA